MRLSGDDSYTCTTLFGRDHCSPSRTQGSSGVECVTPCEYHERDQAYFCYTREDHSMRDRCGFHDVPEEKTEILEFTIEQQLCADYCSDEGTCRFVWWDKWRNKVRVLHLTQV